MGRLEREQSQSKVVLHHSAQLKQSARETEDREQIAGVIGRVLKIA